MKTGIVYLSVRSPEYIRKDMEEIANLGYTHVVHTLSESDFLYYSATMLDIIKISTDLGLKVYVAAWGLGRFFGGEALSELAARNPSQAQVNNFEKPVVASCPNHTSFKDYLKRWLDFVCGTNAETVLWYEPQFFQETDTLGKSISTNWCCRCASCQRLFRKNYGHLMPSSLTPTVQNFRQTSMVNLLSELSMRVTDRGKRNAVKFPSITSQAIDNSVGNWETLDKIAEISEIDEISLEPVWEKGIQPSELAKTCRRTSQHLLETANRHGKEAQIWIRNYLIEKNTEESVPEATFAAFNEGIRNIFAISFKGTRDMSGLRSEDWQRVWTMQTNAFAECHEKATMNEMIKAMKY